MAGEAAQLKDLIQGTDLERYAENTAVLEYAVSYAVSEVNRRRGYTGEGYEPKYRINVIEGALWWLSRRGAEGVSSTNQNGVSITWKEVPDWLKSVIPQLQTL